MGSTKLGSCSGVKVLSGGGSGRGGGEPKIVSNVPETAAPM